jgi:hypothetical protein
MSCKKPSTKNNFQVDDGKPNNLNSKKPEAAGSRQKREAAASGMKRKAKSEPFETEPSGTMIFCNNYTSNNNNYTTNIQNHVAKTKHDVDADDVLTSPPSDVEVVPPFASASPPSPLQPHEDLGASALNVHPYLCHPTYREIPKWVGQDGTIAYSNDTGVKGNAYETDFDSEEYDNTDSEDEDYVPDNDSDVKDGDEGAPPPDEDSYAEDGDGSANIAPPAARLPWEDHPNWYGVPLFVRPNGTIVYSNDTGVKGNPDETSFTSDPCEFTESEFSACGSEYDSEESSFGSEE